MACQLFADRQLGRAGGLIFVHKGGLGRLACADGARSIGGRAGEPGSFGFDHFIGAFGGQVFHHDLLPFHQAEGAAVADFAGFPCRPFFPLQGVDGVGVFFHQRHCRGCGIRLFCQKHQGEGEHLLLCGGRGVYQRFGYFKRAGGHIGVVHLAVAVAFTHILGHIFFFYFIFVFPAALGVLVQLAEGVIPLACAVGLDGAGIDVLAVPVQFQCYRFRP